MSGLSEVSVLIGQRAADLEKAREIFTAEMRAFVTGILGGVRRIRTDPWATSRIRVDLPREIETETKAGGYMSSQFAVARAVLKFKKGTNFMPIADIRFGIEFDETTNIFAWQVSLVPAARYQRIDDVLWHHWRGTQPEGAIPGAVHQDKANIVRFALRPIAGDLIPETAFNDVKTVLEFVLSADAPLASAVGVDFTQADEPRESVA